MSSNGTPAEHPLTHLRFSRWKNQTVIPRKRLDVIRRKNIQLFLEYCYTRLFFWMANQWESCQDSVCNPHWWTDWKLTNFRSWICSMYLLVGTHRRNVQSNPVVLLPLLGCSIWPSNWWTSWSCTPCLSIPTSLPLPTSQTDFWPVTTWFDRLEYHQQYSLSAEWYGIRILTFVHPFMGVLLSSLMDMPKPCYPVVSLVVSFLLSDITWHLQVCIGNWLEAFENSIWLG